MEIRKTQEKDICEILKIYQQAKDYFKAQGIDQWQDEYPDENSLAEDIGEGISYVVTEEDKVIATAGIMTGRDKTYDAIYEGKWLSQAAEYGVIHRIAVAEEKKGKQIGIWLLKQAEEMCYSGGVRYMRIDTHEDNLSMKQLLFKCGYQRCGIIYVEDGTERIAFEKKLEFV